MLHLMSDLECEDLFAGLDHVLDVIFYPGRLRRVSRPLDQAAGERRVKISSAQAIIKRAKEVLIYVSMFSNH